MSTIWQQINNSAALMIETVRQSLVQIRSDEGSIGAGTIWHSDGLIITNAHVVMDRHRQRDLWVTLSNDEDYEAQLLAYDQHADLAALAIDGHDFPTIQIGDSHALKAGQYVMAAGHPWGVVDALTAGIVIGMGANLPEQFDDREWLALDMKMRPGHSGGPLVNSAGQLVGINTLIRGPEVSFAIPVHIVKAFLKESLGQFVESAESDIAAI